MRQFAALQPISSFACIVLGTVLFHPGLASAVALGNIALQSSLGQPLRVVIPVALRDGETLNTSCLRLMRDQAPGTPQLLTGSVSVERNAANTRLIVSTPRPVEEPALRLSLQAGCGDTVRRDYVLLLDPEGFSAGTMVASADVDEFRNYAGAAASARRARSTRRIANTAPVVIADAAPAHTTFTPIPVPPVTIARVEKSAAPIPDAIVELPASPEEPVLLAALPVPGGFMPEAAAASLPRMADDVPNTISASTQNVRRVTKNEPSEETLWRQTWPYGAMLLSIGAIALTALAKRRGGVPAWSAANVHSQLQTPMQNTVSANTFTDFGVKTQRAPKARSISLPARIEQPAYDESVDTLLHQPEVETDGIDEHVVRESWAKLANESSVDIGTDSILEAIATAEREMRVSPPNPAQAAIDQALDDDLMNETTSKR